MLYNQNRITATDTLAGGTSFTLNDDTFYSANANAATGATPVNGSALLNLHATRPAFTITGGWGNPLARNGHWSFPVEVGVALVGAPALNVKLAGWACHDQAQTQCTDISNLNNPIAVQVQNDLQAEIGKWTQDLDPLKTYPIINAGVTYSFHTGRALGRWQRWRIAAREDVFVAHAEILAGLARLLAKNVKVAADGKRDAHVDRLVVLLARARHGQGAGAL